MNKTLGIPVLIKCAFLAFLISFGCSNNDEQEIPPEFTISNTGPYIINSAHLDIVKDKLEENGFLQSELEILVKRANRLLGKEFSYVTDKTDRPDGATPNDYVSMDRYAWPNANGEYTIDARRDGVTNPEIFDDSRFDRERMAEVTSAIYTLSLAYYFTDEEPFAEKASQLVKSWFFDIETRMNPNLDFAQIRPGQSGSGGGGSPGIIDTNDMIRVVEAASLIFDSPSWSGSDHKELKEWFYIFSIWIINNYNADAYSRSNLSTWMDVQRAVYFSFSEQEERLNSNFHISPVRERIDNHINPVGVQTHELSRQRQRHYEYFNLRAYMKLSLVRKNRTDNDRDWPVLNSDDYGGLKPALDLVMDDITNTRQRRDLLDDAQFDDCRYIEIFMRAAIAFKSEEYNKAAQQLIDQGCSNPSITLVYPSLELLNMDQ